MQGICSLCDQYSDLQLSHIIPKFVFNWTKRTCPSFLRNSKEPNVRIQDGEKQHLLCPECERLLSNWEKTFYESVFIPIHEGKTRPNGIRYGDWALKFAVSVAWRNLLFHKQHKSELCSHLSSRQLRAADKALEVWREFLLGGRPHPAQYEQHLVPLDLITSHSVPNLSPYINRYFFRAIDMDLLCGKGTTITYTKLNRVALFGFVEMNKPNMWRGTKLHVRRGTVGSDTYYIPKGVLRYLSDRPNQIAASFRELSDKQSDKITQSIMKDPDLAANSEVFRAMAHDVMLFGNRAFGDKNNEGK